VQNCTTFCQKYTKNAKTQTIANKAQTICQSWHQKLTKILQKPNNNTTFANICKKHIENPHKHIGQASKTSWNLKVTATRNKNNKQQNMHIHFPLFVVAGCRRAHSGRLSTPIIFSMFEARERCMCYGNSGKDKYMGTGSKNKRKPNPRKTNLCFFIRIFLYVYVRVPVLNVTCGSKTQSRKLPTFRNASKNAKSRQGAVPSLVWQVLLHPAACRLQEKFHKSLKILLKVSQQIKNTFKL